MRHVMNSLEFRAFCFACLVGAVASCRGGERQPATDTTTPAAAPSPGAEAVGTTGPAPGPPPAGATSQMVALGDSIFHGQAAGGNCYTCHGADAKGTPLAPPLIKHAWKTGDGSYEFIQKRVTEGMPQPTPPYTAPMLPKGGVPLTDEQVKAVSAYVFSISHP